MSRKKVILKEHILKAAYDIVTNTNFNNLTARNIAGMMNCSTQPIYLEFKNMDELKFVVYQHMKDEMKCYIDKGDKLHDNSIVNWCLNYISFAIEKNEIHRTLANDNFGASRDFKTFIYKQFCEQIQKENLDLSENDKQRIISAMWQYTIGISSTVLNGLMPFDVTKISQALLQTLNWVIDNKDFPTLI